MIFRRGAFSGVQSRQGPALSFAAKGAEQAFALQYTSLILIILTFIAGAFIRPHLPAQSSTADAVSNAPYDFGLIQYNDIFLGDEINTAVTDALVTIGNSHDVVLKFKVFGSPTQDIDADTRIAEAVSRSVALKRHFIDRGLPPEALDVRATASRRNMQAELRISDLLPVGGEI